MPVSPCAHPLKALCSQPTAAVTVSFFSVTRVCLSQEIFPRLITECNHWILCKIGFIRLDLHTLLFFCSGSAVRVAESRRLLSTSLCFCADACHGPFAHPCVFVHDIQVVHQQTASYALCVTARCATCAPTNNTLYSARRPVLCVWMHDVQLVHQRTARYIFCALSYILLVGAAIASH